MLGFGDQAEPSPEAGLRSLKLAKGWLRKAKDSNILGYRDLAVVASSFSMLHAARAILLRDGVEEKDTDHMVEYLKERYPELREHVTSLDQFSKLTSAIQRDPDVSVKRSDAKEAMNSAKELIRQVEGVLK